jgi:O-antigen/teichoic acid export membrane protein
MQISSQAIFLLIGLFLTPFILDKIGLSNFGLWSFIVVTVSLLTVLDPGIGWIISRFVARHTARGEPAVLARITALGICAWLFLGLVMLPIAIFVSPVVAHHLKVSHATQATALTVFFWAYGFLVLYGISSVLSAVLIGIGQAWKNVIADAVGYAGYAIGVVVFLSHGFGIFGLVIASSIQIGLLIIVQISICRRSLGRILGNPLALGRELLRELASFGGWTQFISMFETIATQTDPLVIGAAVSVQNVGVYSIANKLAAQIKFVPRLPQAALGAAMTDAHERGDSEALKRALVSSGRMVSLFGVVLGCMMVGVTPVLMTAWLGRQYADVDVALLLLVATAIVQNIALVGYTTMIAVGRPKIDAYNAAIGAGINLAATLVLVFRFGLVGVLVGTLLGSIVRVALFERRFHRAMGISFIETTGWWIWRLTLVAVAAAVATRAVGTTFPIEWWHHRAGAVPILLLLIVLYGVLVTAGLRLTKFFRRDDLEILQRILPSKFRNMTTNRWVGRLTGVMS